MKFILRATECFNPPATFDKPTWLEDADIEAFDGQGDATLTDEQDKAKRFVSVKEIRDYLYAQPKARPIREDGEPNRPLRAFTFQVQGVTE